MSDRQHIVILYLVQAHRDIDQIAALVRQISDGKNFSVINLDPCLAGQREEIARQLSLHGCNRVAVRVGVPVNWGGVSQIYALLESVAFCLSLPDEWQFLINLSADSVALVPQEQIREFYSARRREGQRIHLHYFGTSTPVSEFVIEAWGRENFELSFEATNLYNRIPAEVSQKIRSMFQARTTSPLFRWKSRGSIHVADLFPERKLVIRPLFPTEAAYRKAAFQDRRVWGGRAWYTIERGALERMLGDPLFAETSHLLEHFFCPDELFIQTYLGLTGRFKAKEINRHNQRYRNGDSGKIHDGMIDELFSSRAFFARKISFRDCPRIMERLKCHPAAGNET